MSDQQPEERLDDQLFCFLDGGRACNASCMAFITFPRPSESSELSQWQAHCALLLAADRLGRSTTIAASVLVENTKRAKTEAIDRQRAGAIPNPFPTSPFPTRTKT